MAKKTFLVCNFHCFTVRISSLLAAALSVWLLPGTNADCDYAAANAFTPSDGLSHNMAVRRGDSTSCPDQSNKAAFFRPATPLWRTAKT